MISLLSVDPGKSGSGWALWDGPKLITYGQLSVSDPLDCWELLAAISSTWAGSRVAVEGQWYRPSTGPAGSRQYHGAPWQSVARLVECRSWWQAAARVAGAEVEVVQPGAWIRATTAGAPGETPDDRIQAVVRMRWPQLRAGTHESAALLLGAYVLERGGTRPIVSSEGRRGLRGVPMEVR